MMRSFLFEITAASRSPYRGKDMKKLKIYLETTEDANNAEACFEELGYDYLNPEGWFLPFWIIAGPGKTFQKVQGEFSGYKYIELQDLEGLVILKRNDLNDATHADDEGRKAIFTNGSWYYWSFNSEKWRRHTKRSLSDPSKLKPIQKPEAPKLHPNTDQLVTRFAQALREKLAKAQEKYGYTDNWMSGDWKTDCQWNLNDHVLKGDPLDVAAYCAFCWHHGWGTSPAEIIPLFIDQINSICEEFGCLPGVDRINWIREQLQQATKTETVYQYAASINTPRGTVHYDGVIAFPGRITGIEDYHKVRAEIAKDGNTTPDKVNVHSLNIVG